jgi:hypothetical protein
VSAAEATGWAKYRPPVSEQLEDVEVPAKRPSAEKASGQRYFSDPAPMTVRNRPGALFASMPMASEYIRSVPLNSLAAGDVNGDGVKELIAAGGDEIHILRFDGRALAPIDQIKACAGEYILHLDAAKLAGAPGDEIYVTSFDGRSANSFVLQSKNNEYARIQEGQPWFFRILQQPDGTAVLAGQDASLNNPFGGSIYRLAWANGGLAAGEKYKLPGGLNIYAFTEAALGGDTRYFAFTGNLFSPEYRLKLMSAQGKEIWRDTQALGGTPKFFKKLMFGNQTEAKEPVPLRIISQAGQSGQRPYVIVARNVKRGQKLLKELMNYTQGEVLCLVWNGAGFEVNWRSGYFNNYVVDYLLDDIDSDGSKELCILSTVGESLGDRAVNKITIYRQAAQ